MEEELSRLDRRMGVWEPVGRGECINRLSRMVSLPRCVCGFVSLTLIFERLGHAVPDRDDFELGRGLEAKVDSFIDC